MAGFLRFVFGGGVENAIDRERPKIFKQKIIKTRIPGAPGRTGRQVRDIKGMDHE